MEGVIKFSALGAACLLFVAPFQEFQEVRRRKHVGERSVLPFVCMWANSVMWMVYGLFIWDIVPTVLTNVFGLAFATYYCVVFAWAVESPSRKAHAYNLFAGTFLLVCALSTFCLGSFSPDPSHVDDERIRQYAGFAASTSTALQYASPLADLVKVVKRRSTEGLSSLMAGVSLLCASLWLWYGLLTNDAFIYTPNVLGVAFSLAQCSLFWLFPRKVKAQGNKEKAIV